MSTFNWQGMVQSGESFLQNKYVSTILIVFFILYGSLVAPKLPPSISKFLDYSVVRLILFFLIAYLASQNPVLALVAALAVFISLQAMHRFQMTEKFVENMVVGSCQSKRSPSDAGVETPAPVLSPEQMPSASEVASSDHTVDAKVVTIMEIEAPKQIVTDKDGQPVKDASGKMVVAPPTVIQDDKGNVVKDESGKPAVVSPKVAVDSTGKPATDKDGKVIVAPPKTIIDEAGVPAKNIDGNYMVVPCEVVVQDDGSIYVVDGSRQRYTGHGRAQGLYGVYQNDATPQERQVQDMSMLCSGSGCFSGYNEGNDLASF